MSNPYAPSYLCNMTVIPQFQSVINSSSQHHCTFFTKKDNYSFLGSEHSYFLETAGPDSQYCHRFLSAALHNSIYDHYFRLNKPFFPPNLITKSARMRKGQGGGGANSKGIVFSAECFQIQSTVLTNILFRALTVVSSLEQKLGPLSLKQGHSSPSERRGKKINKNYTLHNTWMCKTVLKGHENRQRATNVTKKLSLIKFQKLRSRGSPRYKGVVKFENMFLADSWLPLQRTGWSGEPRPA